MLKICRCRYLNVTTCKYPYQEKKLSVNQRNEFKDGIETFGKNCEYQAMTLQQTTSYAKKAVQVMAVMLNLRDAFLPVCMGYIPERRAPLVGEQTGCT